MNTYLFMISHPAHFHLFRNTIDTLKAHGHKVVVVIRPKDVLEQLCVNAGMEYIKIKERSRDTGKVGLALSLIQKTGAVMRIVRQTKPDFMIGCDGAIAYAGKLAGIPSFDCDEDDAEATPLFAKLFYPFFTGIIAPTICSAGNGNTRRQGITPIMSWPTSIRIISPRTVAIWKNMASRKTGRFTWSGSPS